MTVYQRPWLTPLHFAEPAPTPADPSRTALGDGSATPTVDAAPPPLPLRAMDVRDATDDDIRHVCRHMRPEDAAEQLALMHHDDLARYGERFIRMRSHMAVHVCCVAGDGEPVVLFGARILSPGVVGLHRCATRRWPDVQRQFFHYARDVFVPKVLPAQARVAFIDVPFAATVTRRWLRGLGFVELGIPLPIGKCGEPFVMMAWVNPDPTFGVQGKLHEPAEA